MKICKYLLVIIVLILLINSVNAQDSSNEKQIITPKKTIEISNIDLHSLNEGKNFTELNTEIQNANNELNLKDNYSFSGNDSKKGIILNKHDFTINGNNNTIDAKHQTVFFIISNSQNITINDLTLKNGFSDSFGGLSIINSTVTLNNVLFVNGFTNANGGAIIAINSIIYINNNLFLNNTAKNLGGAIYAYDSELFTTDSKFINNTANKYGGAVISIETTYYSLNDEFYDNQANNGAAITSMSKPLFVNNGIFMNEKSINWGLIFGAAGSAITVTNSLFLNTTSNYSTAIYNDATTIIKDSEFRNLHAYFTAGAVSLKEVSNALIDNCTFINTTAEKNAGAIYIDVNENDDSLTEIINVTVIDSYSEFGGAYIQLGGNLSMVDCNFTNNNALFDGGSLYLSSLTYANLENNYFKNNRGLLREAYGSKGGALYIAFSEMEMVNCTFINNSAGYGGGIYVYECDASITESNFKNNTEAVYAIFGDEIVLGSNNYTSDIVILNETNYPSFIDEQGVKLTIINNTVNITGIPSKFDLRDFGWITPVKNQGSNGACWTFGSASAMESVILRYLGYEVDVSENNMQNSALMYAIYGNIGIVEGGSPYLAAGYALSWFGILPLIYDSYDQLGKISPLITTDENIHFQDVVFIPARNNATDNDQIKKALMEYGALNMLYYAAQSAPYFNDETYSQYINETLKIDHAVSIVGWDDNYSKDNFLITPPGDGAFIVKNSWGDSWADNGYFYLSYYDKTFGNDDLIAYVLENDANYNKNYQYDFSGFSRFLPCISYKNTFEAADDDLIAAVGTYFNETGEEYKLEIYVNDELKYAQSGIAPFRGYHTIELNELVPVYEGDEFSAVVYKNSIPLSLQSRVVVDEGCTFANSEGEYEDLSDFDIIACLKVYTIDKVNTTVTLILDNVTYGENITGIIAVNDEFGNNINGTAVVNIGGDEFNVTVANGKGSINVKNNLVSGYHTAKIVYLGDANYNSSMNETEFYVNKIKPSILISVNKTKDNVTIFVKLPQDINDNVTITVNDVKYNVKITDGMGMLVLSNLPNNEYLVTIEYNGNEKYESAFANTTFTVFNQNSTDTNDSADYVTSLNLNQENMKTGNPIILLLITLLALPLIRKLKK